MTQKDLLYLEDAVEHEKSIIKLCNEFINNLNNDELLSFMNEQRNSHEDLKNELMSFLKENANGE